MGLRNTQGLLSGSVASIEGPLPIHLIRPASDSIDSFPATRYYGSKRKLLRWIYAQIRGISFNTALDAFGGTGSVSLLFKAMQKSVAYHDGLRFNEDVGRTVLANNMALSKEDVEELFRKVKPRSGVIAKNFGGIFYTDAENRWLDGFASALDNEYAGVEQQALLRYLLYQACLKKRPFNLFHRSNLRLRTNTDVVRSFGNAVTWHKSFEDHMLQAYDDLSGLIRQCRFPAQIIKSGDAHNIPAGYDLVYIDPPYINLQERYNRDDYWRRYHFLEGLARYDEWGDLINAGSKIMEFEPPAWITEWSRRRTFKERLFSFIRKHRKSIVILSYVTNAYPDESEIKTYFETLFSEVSVHSSEHSHALSKTKRRELIFIGYPAC